MGGKNGAPREADRAWALAIELAALLDEAARAGVDLASALPGAAGRDWAEHWNVTLEFLTIVTKAWPGILADKGRTDIAARQIALLEAQAKTWGATPPATPVIAAGTTGAIPAVAALLRIVSRLPSGLVVPPRPGPGTRRDRLGGAGRQPSAGQPAPSPGEPRRHARRRRGADPAAAGGAARA